MAYRVGRQLVGHGDEMLGPPSGDPEPAGVGGHRRPQHVQAIAVEGLIQGDDPRYGYRCVARGAAGGHVRDGRHAAGCTPAARS